MAMRGKLFGFGIETHAREEEAGLNSARGRSRRGVSGLFAIVYACGGEEKENLKNNSTIRASPRGRKARTWLK